MISFSMLAIKEHFKYFDILLTKQSVYNIFRLLNKNMHLRNIWYSLLIIKNTITKETNKP